MIFINFWRMVVTSLTGQSHGIYTDVGESGKMWIIYIECGKIDKKLSFRIPKLITIKRCE
jgi:hypothetical protein